MTAAQFEELEIDAAADVLAWRFDTLSRAGFDLESSAILATSIEIDLHVAVTLVERGCPPATALRILR